MFVTIVHREDDLPAVAVGWAARLPAAAAHPVVPPGDDPASAAAAAGMAGWPEFHETLHQDLQVYAEKLVTAADLTAVMNVEDEASGAKITAISPG